MIDPQDNKTGGGFALHLEQAEQPVEETPAVDAPATEPTPSSGEDES